MYCMLDNHDSFLSVKTANVDNVMFIWYLTTSMVFHLAYSNSLL